MLTLGIASGEARTWSDATGKFKVEAEFVSLEGGKVTLRGASGKTKEIPLDRLSAADQKLAVELAAGAKSKPTEEESTAAIEKLGGRFSSGTLYLNNTKITDAGLEHLTNPLSPPPTAPSSASRKKQIPSNQTRRCPVGRRGADRWREFPKDATFMGTNHPRN